MWKEILKSFQQKKIQWGCMGKIKGCVCSCKSSASNVEVPVISSVECLTNIVSNGGKWARNTLSL